MGTETLPDLKTPAAFRAWVAMQAPGSCIGYAARPDCCPLQRFLADHGCIEVSEDTIYFDMDATERYPPIPLPAWAEDFVAELDSWFGFCGAVTPEEALNILSTIPGDAS